MNYACNYITATHLKQSKLGEHLIYVCLIRLSRSQWPRSLRHELSSLAQTLESWI
jgi:hypothetical protein